MVSQLSCLLTRAFARRVLGSIGWMAGLATCIHAHADGPPDYDFDFVTIGAVNNPAYTQGPFGPNGYGRDRGSVGYLYRMSRLEVTTAQWMEFANVTASFGDDSIGDEINFAGYERDVGSSAHYSLRPFAGAERFPVFGIPWNNAAKFCNWLQNGKAATPAALLSGAYDLTGDTLPLGRSPGAQYWIPSIDEWIKSVHYDPNRHGPGQGGYWQFPNSSDVRPITGPPSAGGQTNAGSDGLIDGSPLLLGSYPSTRTPWGLLDASGGAAEWLDEPINSGNFARFDGRAALNSTGSGETLDAIWGGGAVTYFTQSSAIGLRLASDVPSPSGLVTPVILWAWCRRRQR